MVSQFIYLVHCVHFITITTPFICNVCTFYSGICIINVTPLHNTKRFEFATRKDFNVEHLFNWYYMRFHNVYTAMTLICWNNRRHVLTYFSSSACDRKPELEVKTTGVIHISLQASYGVWFILIKSIQWHRYGHRQVTIVWWEQSDCIRRHSTRINITRCPQQQHRCLYMKELADARPVPSESYCDWPGRYF